MDMEELADKLKALGDPTRLKIVALLQTRDYCVCEFVPIFGISQPAVSKHLSRLKSAGYVTETRRGQWVYYSLNRERVVLVCQELHNLPDMTAILKETDCNC